MDKVFIFGSSRWMVDSMRYHLAVALVDVAGCFHNFIIACARSLLFEKTDVETVLFRGRFSTTVFRSSW
jgi:hypothetical protein